MEYLGNDFSLKMVPNDEASLVSITPLEKEEWEPMLERVRCGEVESVIWNGDLALKLGVPCNRKNISLNRGDILYVAHIIDGRQPVYATKLSDGTKIQFFSVWR